jgi:hypothetical protein
MDYWIYNNVIKNKILNSDKTIETFSVNKMVGIPGFLASFIISVFTCYLCWKNNENTNITLRIIYCIIAFIFSGIYLLYYYFMYYNPNEKANATLSFLS